MVNPPRCRGQGHVCAARQVEVAGALIRCAQHGVVRQLVLRPHGPYLRRSAAVNVQQDRRARQRRALQRIRAVQRRIADTHAKRAADRQPIGHLVRHARQNLGQHAERVIRPLAREGQRSGHIVIGRKAGRREHADPHRPVPVALLRMNEICGIGVIPWLTALRVGS